MAEIRTPTAAGGVHGKRRWPSGFTLVEVWVGLLITVVIAGASIAAFRGRTKVQTLRRVRDVVVADARFVHQLGLSGKTASVCVVGSSDVSVCTPSGSCAGTCTDKVPKGGFGLRFQSCTTPPCTYQVFADVDGDSAYDADEVLQNGVKTVESPMQTSPLTVGMVGCADQNETWGSVVFAPYSGSATLRGELTNCGGYTGSARLRNIVTFGPTVSGSSVQLIFNTGGGGIQER
ncbi:MAG: hypothetical protein G01um101431_1089 [Parcubacteria group bacterium Gr01-1014_31]|nr:MAG: hypothetical protein G01um101431_1089 [Parcubacteria group bacterium Gr01-1014_31]